MNLHTNLDLTVLEQQKEDILRLLIEKHMIPISSRKSKAFIGQKSHQLLYQSQITPIK